MKHQILLVISLVLASSFFISYAIPQGRAQPDFTLSVGPVSPNPVPASTPGVATITVTSINGFMGVVSLASSITGPSPGFSTLTPASVVVTASSTATATLSVIVPTAPCAAGPYTATVTGYSGLLVHSASTSFTVTAPLPPAPTFTSLSLLYSPVKLNQNPTETWTATVNNPSTCTEYMQVQIAGIVPNTSITFTTMSAVVAVPPGSAVLTWTYLFTNANIGVPPPVTFQFTATLYWDVTAALSNTDGTITGTLKVQP